MSNKQEEFMRQAYALALQAKEQGEVPIGAIVVKKGQVIGKGYNQTISCSDPSAHAEIVAMRDAGQFLSNYRLLDCEVYTTLEPCSMCAGALIHARVKRVFFAAQDPKAGACGSVFSLLGTRKLNHRVEYLGGVLEAECSELLKEFFRAKRAKH